MSNDEKAQSVRTLFKAFIEADRPTAEALLATGFKFTSPYDNEIDKAAYFERCWPNSNQIAEQTVESIVTNGNDVFVVYYCELTNGKAFKNAELHRFKDEQISAIEVFFGRTYKEADG